MTVKNMDRKYYLDFMRIIAILCVIFNHTNEKGYYLYAMTENIFLKYIYYMFSAFIAIGVPIFLMISGSLLLSREESLKEIFLHRICRILAVIFIFSAVQYVYDFMAGKIDHMNLGYFLGHVLSGDLVIPYWFLYTYLLFLLLIPFLRMLVRLMRAEHYIYLLTLYLVLDGVIPIALSIWGLQTERYELPFFHRAVFWPLMGYFMENYVSEKRYSFKNIFFGAILSAGALFVIAYMSARRNLVLEQFTDYDKGLYTCSLTVIFTLYIFFVVKFLFKKNKMGQKTLWLINGIGQLVFGIYLIEQPIRENTGEIWICLDKYLPQLLAAIIWVGCIFAIAAIVTWMLKKIPGIRKLL